jgi:proteic killer suppression protein
LLSLTPRVIANWFGPIIEIDWKDSKLRKDCASDKRGRRRFGDQHWRLLKRRLVSLEAAANLAQLDGVPGRCHSLRADRKGQFAIGLWKGYRLVFEPNDEPPPLTESGELNREKVTRVLIDEVVDYHDD